MTFTLHRGSTPLLVSVPHTGTLIPPDQQHRYLPRALQVEDTDWFLDRLYAFAADLGASLLVPVHSRYLVDLNRPSENTPMYAGQNNTELCPTRFFTGEPLYRPGLEPDAAEVARRVNVYWQPYHDALSDELQRLRAAHGHAVLFDAHSIQSELPWLFDGRLPHMNLGTVGGTSCAPALRDALADVFAAQTRYTHVVDGRFKGGHITRQHGRPAQGVHAVQLEMCWRAYMEETLPCTWHEGRAAEVTPLLRRLVQTMIDWRPHMTGTLLWAPRAWVNGAWRDDVLLQIGSDGCWAGVMAGVPAPATALVLPGPVLPGLVNAHSHAFQRAFAGLAERREGGQDDFWSWRDRMYGVALRITPDQLRAIATQLYTELLQGGCTQVCEFHYLHHSESGAPYADPLAMSRALVEAAADAGIGLTLLPVLYQRAGFAQATLRDDQRRFATRLPQLLALRDGVRALGAPLVSAGVALHSLRAVPDDAVRALVRAVADDPGPIHIHIAEQTAEVDDCLAATGARPIEWLTRELPLDARWQLVHATHALPAEIDAVAASGAGVVLCPSTEANLGDGLADLPRWLASGTPLSLGSDSQVCRHWPEELRWLEYGQRLALRQRNVAARPELGTSATAAGLFDRLLAGGAAAAGLGRWGLVSGARADLLVIDAQAQGLRGVPATHTLDALVFASGAPVFSQVWVAGQCVVAAGAHRQGDAAAAAFEDAMQALWSPT